MQHNIGKMNERVTLLYRIIEENDDGEFKEKIIKGNTYWAKVTPYSLKQKLNDNEWNNIRKRENGQSFKIAMRKIHSSYALQADLIGLSLRGKEMKMIHPLLLSEDEQWLETIVVECGVTELRR
ncbi:MAG: hypothetical protein CNLJKLNK_01324 [Holosporales bacterium]